MDMHTNEGIVDPHDLEKQFQNRNYEGIHPEDAQIIDQFVHDWKIGRNVNTRKGPRSTARLLAIHSKLKTLSRLIQEHYQTTLTKVSEDQLIELYYKMRAGEITHSKGKYKSTTSYVKVYKVFYNWYAKINRKNGINLPQITTDLDVQDSTPDFKWITLESLEKICMHVKPYYQVMFRFIFDSGIRPPKELMNVRRKDLEWLPKEKCYLLNIRDESSKTIGRKVKLLLCSEHLKSYIQSKNFKPDDFLFTKTSDQTIRKTLSVAAFDALGIGEYSNKDTANTIGHKRYIKNGLLPYELRHSSVIYYQNVYTKPELLRYRYGWKGYQMVYYYSRFRGIEDNLSKDDLIDKETKESIEQQIRLQRERNVSQVEQMNDMNERIAAMQDVIDTLATLIKKNKVNLEQ